MKQVGLGLLRAKPYLKALGVNASEVSDSEVGDAWLRQKHLHYND